MNDAGEKKSDRNNLATRLVGTTYCTVQYCTVAYVLVMEATDGCCAFKLKNRHNQCLISANNRTTAGMVTGQWDFNKVTGQEWDLDSKGRICNAFGPCLRKDVAGRPNIHILKANDPKTTTWNDVLGCGGFIKSSTGESLRAIGNGKGALIHATTRRDVNDAGQRWTFV